jgi:hypothetical protein
VCGERGFVVHIGGDDFMFVVPEAAVPETCGGVVETFDTLIPLQYSDADRRAGYYFGKDRRDSCTGTADDRLDRGRPRRSAAVLRVRPTSASWPPR